MTAGWTWRRTAPGEYVGTLDGTTITMTVRDRGKAVTYEAVVGGKPRTLTEQRWSIQTDSGGWIGYGQPTLREAKARAEAFYA